MKRAARRGKPYDVSRHRLQNSVVGPAGPVVFLMSAVLLIGVLPGVVAEERVFPAASECRGAETGHCLRTASFIVESVILQRGRNVSGRVQVVSVEEGGRRLQSNGIDPFPGRVRTGDRVPGTIWRGRITVLADAGGGQRTAARPFGDPLFGAASGIVLVMAEGLGTYAAWWWTRHPEFSARRHPAALVRAIRTATLLVVYAFTPMAVLYERDLGLHIFLALWAPVFCAAVVFSALAAAGDRRNRRHTVMRSEAAPMQSSDAEKDFTTSPAWMTVGVLVNGWSAASGGTPPWLRISAAILAAVWLVLLTRSLTARRRAERTSTRGKTDA